MHKAGIGRRLTDDAMKDRSLVMHGHVGRLGGALFSSTKCPETTTISKEVDQLATLTSHTELDWKRNFSLFYRLGYSVGVEFEHDPLRCRRADGDVHERSLGWHFDGLDSTEIYNQLQGLMIFCLSMETLDVVTLIATSCKLLYLHLQVTLSLHSKHRKRIKSNLFQNFDFMRFRNRNQVSERIIKRLDNR